MPSAKPTLETPHLILRDWHESDRIAFADILADPSVREYLPPTDRMDISKITIPLRDHFAHHNGFGWWAIEERGGAPFIGFIGVSVIHLTMPFAPAIDTGWCMSSAYWGKGYAFEAAQTVMEYGFTTLRAKEIVAFTVEQNHRARALMERLGMTRNSADDFDDPRPENANGFKSNVLYRRKNGG